jgi:hypothetical protein
MTTPKTFAGFSEEDARRQLEEQRKEEEARKKAEERRKKLEQLRKKREEDARKKAEAERLRKEAEERKKQQKTLDDLLEKYSALENKNILKEYLVLKKKSIYDNLPFEEIFKNYENADRYVGFPDKILNNKKILNETLEEFIDGLYGKKKDDDDKPGAASVALPYYNKKDDDDPPEATGGMLMPLPLSMGGSL